MANLLVSPIAGAQVDRWDRRWVMLMSDTEADLENLRSAIKRLDVLCPVVQDNEGMTWRAYQNRFWPTLYLIDNKAISATGISVRVVVQRQTRLSRRC